MHVNQEPNLNIQYFIFCWPGWENAAETLADELMALECDVKVLASGGFSDRTYWVELDPNAYFGDQFLEATERFSGDVLVHIQADASIRDLLGFVKKIEMVFRNPLIGIWAPSVDYTSWTTEVSALSTGLNDYFNLSEELRPVLNTDCTCWALNRSVINAINHSSLKNSHFGWGVDLAACAEAYLQGLVVVRDSSLLVDHPRGTGYSESLASDEFNVYLSSMPPQTRGVVNLLRLVTQELSARESKRIGKRILGKMTRHLKVSR